MADAPASQTLSRGIRILEVLADASAALSIDDIAAALGVHRSIAYRLLRTLEDHGLVARDSSGRITLGARMLALAGGVARDLQSAVLPDLTAIANDLGMTCFVAILDHDEAIALVSVEPRHALTSVSYRPGIRHLVSQGGPGRAILAHLPESAWPVPATPDLQDAVADIRERGYAISANEVIEGLQSVAVPLSLRGQPAASLAVVHVMGELDHATIAARLTRTARSLQETFALG